MTTLATALLDTLDDDALDILAAKLAPRIAGRIQTTENRDDRWMSSREAAEYLGISVPALHKLTATRQIPFVQDGPGCKVWFKESQLDTWRESGGKRGRHV